MKVDFYRIVFIFLMFANGLLSVGKEINPLTQAMLDGYAEILSKSPDDYFTLYQRGAQYYHLSMYDLALNDINRAIKLTPEKEKEMLAIEYQLQADINIQLGEFDSALTAVENGLNNDPQSYSLIYQKGNICLHLNKIEEAQKCFTIMQRMQSRSQEAFFGLAKVAIALGENKEVFRLMDEAEKADPTNYLTYCRLGDLCKDMKDYDKAAAYYLSAFGLIDRQDRPMVSLFDLAKNHYLSVSGAINFAISKSENKLPLFFLKGNIALQNGHLEDAYTAFEKLVEMNDGQTAEVYSSLAECCHYLGNQQEAIQAISKAVTLFPNSRNFSLKSKIERAMGLKDNALSDALSAVSIDSNDINSKIQLALAYLDIENSSGALEQLNLILDNNPDNIDALMIRGYINNFRIPNSTAAVADYMRVARINAKESKYIAYKGLAQTLSGKKLDGDETIAELLSGAENNPDIYYFASVYYSQTGDLEKAVEMLAKAEQSGYENDFNIWDNKDANLNVEPIRYLMNQ